MDRFESVRNTIVSSVGERIEDPRNTNEFVQSQDSEVIILVMVGRWEGPNDLGYPTHAKCGLKITSTQLALS